MLSRAPLFAAVLLVSVPAFATELTCYEEAGTLRNTCFDPLQVRQNGDLRGVGLYSGGPKGVKPVQGMTLVVNCSTKVATLQDETGANFAGGKTKATDQLKALSGWICEVKKTKLQKTLRQF
jgi:hypothetical protein